MKNKILYNYFFILFSIIPISILIGSAASSINLMIISLSFIIYSLHFKNWEWVKNKHIQLLFILYLYLIFNSFISLDFKIGINRNFGFILYVIFFAAFSHFLFSYKKFNRIFIVWTTIITIVVIDIYLEALTGKSMTGYSSNDLGIHDRVYSFFIDEAKVGGYIGCFFLILTGHFLNICELKSNKWKYIIIIISLIFLISIIITGERSSGIRAIIAFFIFFIICRSFSKKEKILSFGLVFLIFAGLYLNSNFMKYRYGQTIFEKLYTISHVVNYFKKTNYKLSNDESPTNFTKEEFDKFQYAIGSNYFELYISSLKVFVNYPIFGVGNKNYRVVTCTKYAKDEIGTIYYQFYKSNDSSEPELYNSHYICNSHPHQIYFEFLAEHGIIGTLILLFVFFKLIFYSYKKIISNKNYFQLGALIYIFLVFLPFLPSGSFFNNYVATLFWINLSIMLGSTKPENI